MGGTKQSTVKEPVKIVDTTVLDASDDVKANFIKAFSSLEDSHAYLKKLLHLWDSKKAVKNSTTSN